MKQEQLQFQASDAWLQLTIILAAGNNVASLEEIVAAGDGINPVIFTEDEMESGLYRLHGGGYINESNGSFWSGMLTDHRRSIRRAGILHCAPVHLLRSAYILRRAKGGLQAANRAPLVNN